MVGVEFDTHAGANAVQQAAFERGLLVLEAASRRCASARR